MDLRVARASLTWPLKLEAFMRLVAAVAILFALAFPAGAEDAKSEEKPAPSEAVLAFGVSHPECQEWSDGCVICARGVDVVNCSTPGIACLPVETVCKRPAK